MPVGEIVYLADEAENVSRVSTAGRAYFSDSYSRIKNHSPINVSSASGGSGFESAPVGKMYIRSESGNSIMWIGGSAEDAPYSGHGFPLFGGETSPILYVNDFSATRICAAVSGEVVFAIGFLNGTDVELTRTSPVYPDIVAPFVSSHSPVSGLSGIALNSDVYIRFSEAMRSGSAVSGNITTSPAHNVSIFRDTTNTTDIYLRPNVNWSGATTYTVTLVSGTVQDLYGNYCASGIVFPFTTTNAPPPPDVIAPVVSGITPLSGVTEVATSTDIVVTFSERMLSGTINTTTIFLATTSGASSASAISGTVALDGGDEKTATLNPAADLAEGTVHYINVTSGCQDLASTPSSGNALSPEIRNRPFTTGYNYSFQEVYNVTGTTDLNSLYSGSDSRCGVTITGSCALKGTDVYPKRVVARLKKVGSPTGTAYIRMRKSTDTIGCEFGSIDVSTLTTEFADYIFTNMNNIEPTDSNDDKILIEYSGGDASNYLAVQRNANDVYSGAEYVEYRSDNTYQALGGRDVCFRIYK